MENQRSDEPGRREDDRRWLKVQGDIMNLVTSQRTSQQVTAKLELEVGKLADHIDEVDDHLRGVAGKDSMDTRVNVMEKSVFEHSVLLREIAKHFGALEAGVAEIRSDISTLKFHRAIAEKTEASRMERLKEWLKFWGPIIIASLALVVPMYDRIAEHIGKFVFSLRSAEYTPDDRLRKQIEADKKGARGKAVKKKLAELERAQRERN